MLRYFGRIHAREIATEELLRVHTVSHVRNYYPMDDEDVIKKEEPLAKPLKVTSIAAILNPAPSSPTKPAFNTRSQQQQQQQQQSPMVMRGVGGGVVIQADQDHIKRQHRRFSSEAAAVDASQTNPQPIAPPDLVCKMTCGELGIAVDTTFHPLHSSLSARVAAGALLALVEPIVQGQMRNGFALVRPPGRLANLSRGIAY
jgi:acetoin utilization deacetylase AcuC-like enzyme